MTLKLLHRTAIQLGMVCTILALAAIAVRAQPTPGQPLIVVTVKGRSLIADALEVAQMATTTANLNIVLNLFAGLAGLATGFLSQLKDSKSGKRMTLALGVFIGAVTLINNTFWAVDAQAVMNQVDAVRSLTNDVKSTLDLIDNRPLPPDQVEIIHQQSLLPTMTTLTEELEALRNAGVRPGSRIFRGFNLSASAAGLDWGEHIFSQRVLASSVAQFVREEDAYVYFQGVGQGPTPGGAIEVAKNEALNAAANYYFSRWRTERTLPSHATVASLNSRLTEIATIDRSSVVIAATGFGATTVIKIPRLLMQPQLIAPPPPIRDGMTDAFEAIFKDAPNDFRNLRGKPYANDGRFYSLVSLPGASRSIIEGNSVTSTFDAAGEADLLRTYNRVRDIINQYCAEWPNATERAERSDSPLKGGIVELRHYWREDMKTRRAVMIEARKDNLGRYYMYVSLRRRL